MFEFIVLLRALSAMIITNAHYENIYPISIIANGGLLGDVVFFAVSGFCLYKPKTNFVEWYKKRLIRIYPTVWLITLIYTVLGYYEWGNLSTLFSSFIFPTHYHFIGSIVLLYIPFYVICYIADKVKVHESLVLKCSFAIVLSIQLVWYLFAYDKTFYHIDSVYEPMIRLLFLEAMLMGSILRENIDKYTAKVEKKYVVSSILTFILYFGFKIGLTKYTQLSNFQIFNQYILLALLSSILLLTAGMEYKVREFPRSIYKVIRFISQITLEIYLVQYALIYWLNIGPFPVNFIIVSSAILICALILHNIRAYFSN